MGFIIIIGNLFCALLMLNHLILKIIPMVSNVTIPISQRSKLRHRVGRYLVKVPHPETWRSQNSVSVRLQSPVSCINRCRPAWQSTVDRVAKVKKKYFIIFLEIRSLWSMCQHLVSGESLFLRLLSMTSSCMVSSHGGERERQRPHFSSSSKALGPSDWGLLCWPHLTLITS